MFVDNVNDIFDKIHHICVVGSGPVGLVTALELASLGQAVTLLESGLLGPDANIQALSEAFLVDPQRNRDMALAVQRSFGGTSNLWGAGCVPLDPVDFARRPITADAAWPLSYEEFAAHLKTACQYANCGTSFEEPVTGIGTADDRFSAHTLIRYAQPPSFGKAYRSTIAKSPLITACLGASVTGLCFAEGGGLAGVEVRSAGGGSGVLRARIFVLACGGVETTRLLLAAQAESPARFGGEGGPLGRYYMGHLSGDIADIRLNHAGLDKGFDFFRAPDGAYGRRRLTASGAFQTKENLTNISFWPKLPAMSDPSHRDPILSLAYLALSFPPLGRALMSESLRRINVGEGTDRLAHMLNVLRGIPAITRFLPAFVHRRMLSKRRLPGLHMCNGARRYPLHYHAEHLPNANSRVYLSKDRDVLGLRKVALDLRFSSADAQAVVRTHQHLGDWLKGTGLGELIWHDTPAQTEAKVLEFAGDGVHQIGTARMAASAREGVVDRNCRVFGCDNLFLAGSAVFPTSGQANPTLSAIALAVRLARQIAVEAATHTA